MQGWELSTFYRSKNRLTYINVENQICNYSILFISILNKIMTWTYGHTRKLIFFTSKQPNKIILIRGTKVLFCSFQHQSRNLSKYITFVVFRK